MRRRYFNNNIEGRNLIRICYNLNFVLGNVLTPFCMKTLGRSHIYNFLREYKYRNNLIAELIKMVETVKKVQHLFRGRRYMQHVRL